MLLVDTTFVQAIVCASWIHQVLLSSAYIEGGVCFHWLRLPLVLKFWFLW